MKDLRQITYFSFSANQYLYDSLLSAARQADSSQLKIFDQDKNLIMEIDGFDLFFSWIESVLDYCVTDLFSGEIDIFNSKEIDIFNSKEDEKLFLLHEEIAKKLRWREDIFSSDSKKSEVQKCKEFSSLMKYWHEQEKELRILSFSDCSKLYKKIYLLLAGMIDCYLQFMPFNPEVPKSLIQNSTFDLYKNLKQPKLRTITFCAAIKDFIFVEKEYQDFIFRTERKLLDRLNEWYF